MSRRSEREDQAHRYADEGGRHDVNTWRFAVGGRDLYRVSRDGIVWSVRANRALCLQLDRKGYYCVDFCIDGRKLRRYVGPLVLATYAGPRPAGMVARHGPGGKRDNRWPENLCWGTPEENESDKDRDGTRPIGERHWHTTVTEAEVTEIRLRYAAGESQTVVGKAFRLSPAGIGKIVRGENWAHVATETPADLRPNTQAGERSGKAKLTWAIADEIRARRANGETVAGLAREFGVTAPTVWKVVTGRTWPAGDLTRGYR